MSRFKALTLACGLSLISACGFQLRGAVDLAPDLAQLNLQGFQAEAGLEQSLQQSLQSNKIHINDSAELSLTLLNSRREERLGGVDSQGNGRLYDVEAIISFSLIDQASNTLAGPFEARSLRRYSREANANSATSTEGALINAEIDAELARQVMLRLQAVSF